MSVPIPSPSCAAKSKPDQITSHYGLTEDDLINQKLPPKLKKLILKLNQTMIIHDHLNVINSAVHHPYL